jgi:recombinational DNA repair ATPase RecF
VTEGVGRIKSGYAVGKLSQGSGELIVFSVIVASLDCVATHDGCFPVIIVAFVRVEVDLQKHVSIMELVSNIFSGV